MAVKSVDLEWHFAARRILVGVALRAHDEGVYFTNDDVRSHVLAEVGPPSHPNVWGALYRSAKFHGIIRPVGAKPSIYASRAGGIHLAWVLTDRMVDLFESLAA